MAAADPQVRAEQEAEPQEPADRQRFRAWFQTHEKLVLVVGAIAALAAVAMWWRGQNQSSSGSNTTPGAGGIPTSTVTDSTTSQALDNLTAAISALLAKLSGNNGDNTGGTSSSSGTGGVGAPPPGPVPAPTPAPGGSISGTATPLSPSGATPISGSAGMAYLNGGGNGQGIINIGSAPLPPGPWPVASGPGGPVAGAGGPRGGNGTSGIGGGPAPLMRTQWILSPLNRLGRGAGPLVSNIGTLGSAPMPFGPLPINTDTTGGPVAGVGGPGGGVGGGTPPPPPFPPPAPSQPTSPVPSAPAPAPVPGPGPFPGPGPAPLRGARPRR